MCLKQMYLYNAYTLQFADIQQHLCDILACFSLKGFEKHVDMLQDNYSHFWDDKCIFMRNGIINDNNGPIICFFVCQTLSWDCIMHMFLIQYLEWYSIKNYLIHLLSHLFSQFTVTNWVCQSVILKVRMVMT